MHPDSRWSSGARLSPLQRRYRQKQWRRTVRRHCGWAIAWISLSLMLGGCVDVEAGIQFWDANHGAIIQTVRLDGSLAALTTDGKQAWFDGLVARSRELGGKTIERSPGIVTVKIPFHNGADLSQKFNELIAASANYSPLSKGEPSTSNTPLVSSFSLSQRNFGLAVKNHLEYDLDLRLLKGWSLDATEREGIRLRILPRQRIKDTFDQAGPTVLKMITVKGID
ncbi:MAG: DUF3153 domain-containing protein, partial [Cyanophyceae cyanobacterium]